MSGSGIAVFQCLVPFFFTGEQFAKFVGRVNPRRDHDAIRVGATPQ